MPHISEEKAAGALRPASDMARRAGTGVALLLLVAIACQPLLGGPPAGHDALVHYYRIPPVSELWQQGIPYARWLPDLVYGYGSPLFNFYPPLSAYLLTALYWLVGQNGPLAYTLSYAIALSAGVGGMYLVGRALWGSTAGLFAAAAYTLSPHILLHTYGRGSLSNALAAGLAPLALVALLWAARAVRDGGSAPRRIAGAAFMVALLPAAHLAAGFLFVPVLLFVALVAARFVYRGSLAPPLLAILLGMALSAFVWMPALLEIDVTRYAQTMRSDVTFGDYFAAILHWPAFTIAGQTHRNPTHSTGLVQLLLGLMALPVAGQALWQRAKGGTAGKASEDAGRAVLALAMGPVIVAALFFASAASAPLWAAIAPLRQLQFPWRFLDIAILLLPLTAAFLWRDEALAQKGRGVRVALLLSGLIILFLNALPSLYPERLHDLPRQPTAADTTRVQHDLGFMGLTAWGEYSSAEVEAWPEAPPFEGADQGAALAAKLDLPADVDLRAARGSLLSASWELFLPTATVVNVFVHYFPGWQASINGQQTPIMVADDGHMQVRVPAGNQQLTLDWGRTLTRTVADGLSLLALAVGVLLMWQPAAVRRLLRALHGPGTSEQRGGRIRPHPLAPVAVVVVVLALLLLSKVAFFDRVNTPFVLHPSPDPVPGATQPEHGDFGPLQLTGYDLRPSGELTLYWYAPQTVGQALTVRVYISAANGTQVHEITNQYPGGRSTQWWQGEMLVRDSYRLTLDQLPPPALYELSVAVLDEEGEPLRVVDGPDGATTTGIGSVRRPPPDEAGEVVLDSAVAATFTVDGEEALTLANVALPEMVRRGERASLTLYWRCEGVVANDYTVYLHVLRPDGEFVTAFDGPPRDGVYPTSAWQPGEQIVDQRSLPADLPPGDYMVRAGLYEPESGERLTLGAPHEGADGLVLGTFTVTP